MDARDEYAVIAWRHIIKCEDKKECHVALVASELLHASESKIRCAAMDIALSEPILTGESAISEERANE